jgi:hypothetical protein
MMISPNGSVRKQERVAARTKGQTILVRGVGNLDPFLDASALLSVHLQELKK